MQPTLSVAAMFIACTSLTAQATLEWSTHLGGNSEDIAYATAFDPATGHVFLAGHTTSSNFPFTNAVGLAGDRDVYVARFDPNAPSGSQLVWCTRIGGNGYDAVHEQGLALSPTGQIAVVGQTGSTNLPTTSNAYDQTWNGLSNSPGVDSDTFVAVLDAGGSINYLSYFGGEGGQYGDYATAAVWDASGRIAMAGFTEATANFPITANAFDSSGGGDGWFAILDPNQAGAGLVYSSFFGVLGFNDGGAQSIAISPAGVVTIAGNTNAPIPAFASLSNVFDATFDGPYDAYVANIDTNISGSAGLLYGTYIGGSAVDLLRNVFVDANGIITAVGQTSSGNFPVSAGAVPTPAASNNGFLFRLAPFGNGAADLLYATMLGGSGYDPMMSVVPRGTDENQLMAVQITSSTGLATTYAADDSLAGARDLLLSYFDFTSAAPRVTSRYFGGTDEDVFYMAAAHPDGYVTAVGWSDSNNYPTTANAYMPNNAGGKDAVVVTFDVAAMPYGSGVNPEQSLVTLAGEPRLGSTWTLGVDDPANQMVMPGLAILAISTTRASATSPALFGELLLDPATVLVVDFAPWFATPTPLSITLPNNPAFVGMSLYVQGAILGGAGSGLKMTIGLDVKL